MRRIALILLLFILLGRGPPLQLTTPLPAASLQVRAIALPLPVEPPAAGPLRLTGLWRLVGSHDDFGGISALLSDGESRFTALSDSGEATTFTLGGKGRIAGLPRPPGEQWAPARMQDSESLTRDPGTGRLWVGFERVQRICRYAPGFARLERCVSPPELGNWPAEGSLESLVRLGDGRFMALAERGNAPGGGFDILLWPGDPVEPGARAPVHMTYRGPAGFRPTDALWLGGDRLLVLTRRLTFAQGFSARLTLVRLPRLSAGAVLRGETIAVFQGPGPADNMEALALGRDARGRPVLYVASDDNHLFLQRTLLFRFALPPGWVSAASAP